MDDGEIIDRFYNKDGFNVKDVIKEARADERAKKTECQLVEEHTHTSLFFCSNAVLKQYRGIVFALPLDLAYSLYIRAQPNKPDFHKIFMAHHMNPIGTQSVEEFNTR